MWCRVGRRAWRLAGRLAAFLLALALAASLSSESLAQPTPAASPDSTLRIAFVTAPVGEGADLVQLTRREVQAAFAGHAQVAFGVARDAGTTPEDAARALQSALDDPEVDAVVAAGPFAPQAAAEASSPLPKPLVAIDPSGSLFASSDRGDAADGEDGADGEARRRWRDCLTLALPSPERERGRCIWRVC
jgi:hypothetical protein